MRVIVVGGFLGAGKTTLIAQTARQFAAQGRRVGIITNDQAADLVDTHFLAGLGIAVEEVAGGCFCCRFEDFERSANRLLKSIQPDVLLSEPVGSCTDIAATVLRPMKRKWGKWADISAFSVLADPRRLRQVLDAGKTSFPESVRYIIKKQLEEADYLVLNKIDLLSPDENARLKDEIASVWPGVKILEMSALKNVGVSEWMSTISGDSNGGQKMMNVDYETYASGEAELGWLNASFSLVTHQHTDWNALATKIMDTIHSGLASRSAEIGHIKILLSVAGGQLVANITRIGEKPAIQSSIGISAGPASLIVNARANLDPDTLKSIVEHSIKRVTENKVRISQVSLSSFKPAYPKPTYRIESFVV